MFVIVKWFFWGVVCEICDVMFFYDNENNFIIKIIISLKCLLVYNFELNYINVNICLCCVVFFDSLIFICCYIVFGYVVMFICMYIFVIYGVKS